MHGILLAYEGRRDMLAAIFGDGSASEPNTLPDDGPSPLMASLKQLAEQPRTKGGLVNG
jgi:hypothetical protein